MAQKQATLQSTIETMYRFTADDYTREEIRAREEELRVQRTIESIHKRELKERDDKIAEQDTTIAEQSVTITEQSEEIKRLLKQIEALQKQVATDS